MGMSEADLARLDTEVHRRAWEGFCKLPGPRAAKALRMLLGLSASRAAMLAELPENMVYDFERGSLDFLHWHTTSRRLHHAFAKLGGGWCEPELHDGAYCVTLGAPSATGAGDLEAIKAALALMGHRARSPRSHVSPETLAKRLAKRLGIPLRDVRAELAGRSNLSDRVRAEAFRQLGSGRGGAGAYFERSGAGGWGVVGCDFAGCWW